MRCLAADTPRSWRWRVWSGPERAPPLRPSPTRLDGTAVISSDRIRKRLAGLDPLDRTDAAVDTGIYSADVTQRVYRGLLDRAESVVGSGRVAVLDATFSSPDQRKRLPPRSRGPTVCRS